MFLHVSPLWLVHRDRLQSLSIWRHLKLLRKSSFNLQVEEFWAKQNRNLLLVVFPSVWEQLRSAAMEPTTNSATFLFHYTFEIKWKSVFVIMYRLFSFCCGPLEATVFITGDILMIYLIWKTFAACKINKTHKGDETRGQICSERLEMTLFIVSNILHVYHKL